MLSKRKLHVCTLVFTKEPDRDDTGRKKMDLAIFGFSSFIIIEFIHGSMPKKQETLKNDMSCSLLYWVTFKQNYTWNRDWLIWACGGWNWSCCKMFFFIHKSKMVTFSKGILSCKILFMHIFFSYCQTISWND